MKNKIWLLINLALLTFTLFICNQAIGQTTAEVEKESENLKIVTQHFFDHDLIAQMANDKTTKIDVYHIKESKKYSWPTTEMRMVAIECRNSLYLVDVTTKDQAMKYLYCVNETAIKLISMYELRSNNWTKLK